MAQRFGGPQLRPPKLSGLQTPGTPDWTQASPWLAPSQGALAWQVSEIGYGMWGMGGWTGSDDGESAQALQLAVDLGCNFFDTAWGYGAGHSEKLLGRLVRANPSRTLFIATKIPPKNMQWPSRRGDALQSAFPAAHIRKYVEKSLANLALPSLHLIQFHVWEDDWAEDVQWQRAMDDLKREGLVEAVGVSINRWEPANVIRTLRTGNSASSGF